VDPDERYGAQGATSGESITYRKAAECLADLPFAAAGIFARTSPLRGDYFAFRCARSFSTSASKPSPSAIPRASFRYQGIRVGYSGSAYTTSK
jgi:hypothetical protein